MLSEECKSGPCCGTVPTQSLPRKAEVCARWPRHVEDWGLAWALALMIRAPLTCCKRGPLKGLPFQMVWGLVGEPCNVVKTTDDVTENTSIVDIVATQEGLACGVPVLGLQRKDFVHYGMLIKKSRMDIR